MFQTGTFLQASKELLLDFYSTSDILLYKYSSRIVSLPGVEKMWLFRR